MTIPPYGDAISAVFRCPGDFVPEPSQPSPLGHDLHHRLRRMVAVQLRQLGDIAASEATMREAAQVMRAQRPGGGASGPGSR